MSESSGPSWRPEHSDTGQVLAADGAGRRPPGFVPAATVALAAAALGVGVGLLWRLLAPHVMIIKAEQGFLYADPQPEQAVAADGWFAFLGVAAGLLAAIVAWIVLRRQRGVVVLVALVLGSLLGAWLGWWLSVRLETARFDAVVASAPLGSRLEAPLSLRITDLDRDQWWLPKATGVIVAQALAAAAVYTALAGFATDPDLRPGRPEPDGPPSWWDDDGPPPGPGVRTDRPGLSSDPDGPPGPPGSPARP